MTFKFLAFANSRMVGLASNFCYALSECLMWEKVYSCHLLLLYGSIRSDTKRCK